MPNQTIHRTATQAEQVLLEQLLRDAPTRRQRWRWGAEYAVVLWATSLLAFVILWLGSAWVARKLFAIEFGMHSGAAIWVLGMAAAMSAVVAVWSGIQSTKRMNEAYRDRQTDVIAGQIHEEHYDFTSAMRFQEPEHGGGLIYFLRTIDDRVLTLYDYESIDLGMDGKSPLLSSFSPMSKLMMIRTSKTGLVIDKRFSGQRLEAGEPFDLCAEPEQWPESDCYTDIPWSRLEARLGTPKTW